MFAKLSVGLVLLAALAVGTVGWSSSSTTTPTAKSGCCSKKAEGAAKAGCCEGCPDCACEKECCDNCTDGCNCSCESHPFGDLERITIE